MRARASAPKPCAPRSRTRRASCSPPVYSRSNPPNAWCLKTVTPACSRPGPPTCAVSSSPAAPPTWRETWDWRARPSNTTASYRHDSGKIWLPAISISGTRPAHERCEPRAVAPLPRAAVRRDLAVLRRLLPVPQGVRGPEATAQGAVRPGRRPHCLPVDHLSVGLHARSVPGGMAGQTHGEPARADLRYVRRGGLQCGARCVGGLPHRERIRVDVRDDGDPRPVPGDGLAAQCRPVRQLDAPFRARDAVRAVGYVLPARRGRGKGAGRFPARLAGHGLVLLRFEPGAVRDYGGLRPAGARAAAIGPPVTGGRCRA